MGQNNKKTARRHPYSDLPPSRYWRSAVGERHIMELEDLYVPKFVIGQADHVTVAGSCFAQHVGRSLVAQGFTVLNEEPTPEFLSEDVAQQYGYGIYSARYGNIYSARQLVQLIRDCSTGAIREEDFWERDGRIFDALRPSVEPDGLGSLKEAVLHRLQHLAAVRTLLNSTDIMIFTLGLTEAWENRRTGTIYPTCPGVIAGEFDDHVYGFVNFNFNDVLSDMIEVRNLLKAINPNMKLLLTVSPVPLTATASGKNVLVATTYSKSVLRAVCGSICDMFDDVDYFPSYEIVASPASRGFFYEPNLRSINRNGVAHVMSRFLKAHMPEGQAEPQERQERQERKRKNAQNQANPARERRKARMRSADDVVCEEELLEAFAG